MTERRVLDTGMIAGWLDLTGDRNPLHTDSDYAAGTQFGQPIVPGHLLAALVVDEAVRALGREHLQNARLSVRFVGPLPVGQELRLDCERTAERVGVTGSCASGEVLTAELEPLVEVGVDDG